MSSDALVLLDLIDAALADYHKSSRTRAESETPFGRLLALAEARARACRVQLIRDEPISDWGHGRVELAQDEVRAWAKAWGLDG